MYLSAVIPSFLLTFGTAEHIHAWQWCFQTLPFSSWAKAIFHKPLLRSPALLSCNLHSRGVNLASPQTTQHQFVWVRAVGSVCESGGAHHPCCTAGLPGSVGIEQRGLPRAQSIKNEAFCTMGIDMNNPCYLYPSLCYCAYPITFSAAFSSNNPSAVFLLNISSARWSFFKF